MITNCRSIDAWRKSSSFVWNAARFAVAAVLAAQFSFTATAAVNPQYPVILVHGLNSSATTWKGALATLANGVDNAARVRAVGLSSCQWSRDWPFFSVFANWSSTAPSAATKYFAIDFSDANDLIYQEQANELKTTINCVRSLTGSNKVILVGHSMGGLASRAYVQGLAYSFAYAQDVERIVTVGTPHGGSIWGDKLTFTTPFVGSNPGQILGDAILYLSTKGDAIQTLNDASFPNPSPSFVSIRAKGLTQSTSDGDGIVSLRSQSLITALQDAARTLPAWVTHPPADTVVIADDFDNLFCGLLNTSLQSITRLAAGGPIDEVHTCETADAKAIERIATSIPTGAPSPYVLGAAVTRPATDITLASAMLRGRVVRGQANDLYWKFKLGTSRNSITTVGSQQFVPATYGERLVAYTASNLNANSTYYYQLCAIDGLAAETCGDVRTFVTTASTATLATPALQAPANGTNGLNQSPTLIWSDVANATSYRVVIALTPGALPTLPEQADCGECVVNDVESDSVKVIATGALQPLTTYYWKVKARGADRYGTWSASATFSTGAFGNLSAPGLTSPANAVQLLTNTPTLNWSAVSGATSYRVLVARNLIDLPASTYTATCPSCVVNDIVGGASLAVAASTLQPGQTYYWKVKGRSAAQYGDYSAVRSFTLTQGVAAGGACTFSAIPSVSTFAVSAGGTIFSSNLVAPPGCVISVTNSNAGACVVNAPNVMPSTGSATLTIAVQSTASARSCSISVAGLAGTWVFNQSATTTLTYPITTNIYTGGSLSSSGGSVSGCSGNVANGSTCNMVATPNAGYYVAGWAEGATVLTGSSSYSFVVSAPRTLTASFQALTTYGTYTVSISGPPEARMRPSDGTGLWRKHGDTVRLTAGDSQSTQCSAVPNFTLTSITSPAFTGSSAGGTLQCTYAQTTAYLSPLLTQAPQPRISAGAVNSLARLADGTVVTWGWGQLGMTATGWGSNAQDATVPLVVAGAAGAQGVVSDRQGIVTQRALLSDGSVVSWGSGLADNLGIGVANINFLSSPTTSTVYGSSIRKVVSASDLLVLRTNGEVWRYSLNRTPVDARKVAVPANVVDIASRGDYAYALDREGRVWNIFYENAPPNLFAMGVSGYSGTQSGFDVFAVYDERPTVISGLNRISALANAYHVSLALREDGTVWVWGVGSGSNFLAGATYPRLSHPQNDPVQITTLPGGIRAIAAGGAGAGYALAVDASGSVWSWGDNSAGQLGRSVGGSTATPGAIPGLTGVIEVSAGDYHALALKADGTVWAWGRNQYGTLGNGSKVDSLSPVQVACPSGFTGFLNLLSTGCTPKTQNLLSIAFDPSDPVVPTVRVNGQTVTLPYQAALPSATPIGLSVDAPINYAPSGWRGDIDTVGGTFTSTLSLPMNRDWSLVARVTACSFSPNSDLTQNGIAASGVSLALSAKYSYTNTLWNRCTWQASSNQSWAKPIPASGTGMVDATSRLGVTVIIEPNLTISPRTAQVTVGTLTYSLTQLGSSASTSPSAFGLGTFVNAAENIFVSSPVQVAGINSPTPIAVDPTGEISINGGAFSSASSTVNNGDSVVVRTTSASMPNVTKTVALSIGAVSSSPPLTVTTAGCSLDIDGNGQFDAATDGVLLARFALGIQGNALTAGALGVGASRTTAEAISGYIQAQNFDFDNNGSMGFLTDVAMALRSLRGLAGDAVTANSIGLGAQRTAADTQVRVAGCR